MDGRPVLLTGASGLLGTWLVHTAPAHREVVGVVHRRDVPHLPTVTADLREGDAVLDVVRRVRPSVVIHAAYAKDPASIVGATENVVAAAAAVGADIVLISTDAVFSGSGPPCDERAVPDPCWDYGRWKAEAERIVARSEVNGSIVRLPLVVSVDPPDHVVARITAAAARGERTNWYVDELRQPARAGELADAVWRITLLDPADRRGAWHLPGPECLDRYETAQRVVTTLGLDAGVIAGEHAPASSRRPRRLVLQDARARRQIGWSPSRVLT